MHYQQSSLMMKSCFAVEIKSKKLNDGEILAVESKSKELICETPGLFVHPI
jgi:hypothetical protein